MIAASLSHDLQEGAAASPASAGGPMGEQQPGILHGADIAQKEMLREHTGLQKIDGICRVQIQRIPAVWLPFDHLVDARLFVERGLCRLLPVPRQGIKSQRD